VQLIVKPATEPATLTVPAKFWVLVRVRASVFEEPVLKLTSDDAAETVKSPTWTTMAAECVPTEPVPVKLTTYVPATVDDRLQVVPTEPPEGTVTELGLQADTVNPVEGLTVVERATLPVKPFMLETVTDIDPPEAPALKLTGVMAVTTKSPVVLKEAVALVVNVPGEPVAVMVNDSVLAMEAVQVLLDVPVPFAERVIVDVLKDWQTKPVGIVLFVRDIVPTKLKVLVRVMLDVSGNPTGPFGLVALIMKPPICTVEMAAWEAVPGVPLAVIVAAYVPGVVELRVQEAVAVVLAVRLVAVVGQVTDRPELGVTADDSWIVPTKLDVLVRLTEMVPPGAPLLKFTGELREIVKSPTCTVVLAEWDAVPGEALPVMVTEYVPAVVDAREHEAVTVALAVMLVAVDGQVTVRPVAGLGAADRLIVPAKSNVLVNVMLIELVVAPELKSTGPLAEII
jgi:hypothetical protein